MGKSQLLTLFFCLILLFSFILNFYKLDKNPPGLYLDEVSIGVNGYSTLTKGIDEYGEKYPLYFKSYGEYKLPVYIYLTAISMKIFGKNEFAIRFPSFFFGILTLIVVFLLVKEISSKKIALLTTFILSVSPWFIHLIGPAFETTVALFFFILGFYLFILFQKANKLLYLVLCLFSFLITIFTYNSYKIVTPIFFLVIIFWLLRNKNSSVFHWLVASVFTLIVLWSLIFNPSNVRFIQTSALTNDFWENIILVSKNYLSYFSFDFLYNAGDGNNRHQLTGFGVLARWTLPFLILGSYLLFKKKNLILKNIIPIILFVAPIPAVLTLPSPHTLRSFLLVIPFSLIIGLGLNWFNQRFSKMKIVLSLIITVIFVYELSLYLHFNYFHYQKTALMDWGGSFKELAVRVKTLKPKYEKIVVSDNIPFAVEYLKFYNDDDSAVIIKPGFNVKKAYGGKAVLLIVGFVASDYKAADKFLENIYLPNDNRDVFAQLWEI